MEKRTDMNRLYHCDETPRMELIVHLSLGLSAFVAVACALGATFDFCRRLDQMATEETKFPALVSSAGDKKGGSLTNAADARGPSPCPTQPGQTNPASVPPAA